MDVRAATGPSGQASIPEGGGGMTRLKDLINLDELSMKICPNCRVPGVCNERDLRCDFQKAIRELRAAIARRKRLEKQLARGRAILSASTPLGLKKYDKRRKMDTPKRKLWRERKANPKFDGLGRPRKEDTPQRKKWRAYKNRAEVVPAIT